MGRAEARRAQKRGRRRAKVKKRGGIGRFFTFKKLFGAFLTVCLLGILGFVGLYLLVDVPANANGQATAQSNVYKYADGSVMARTGFNRESVPISDIPKDVQHTFVAAENKTFYKDSGVDLKGTARGILNTLRGRGKQGGSTITQQFVKNYYLTQEQTVSRKLKEIVISLKVDQKLGKDQILAGYINTSYYGRGAYGIEAAAQAYYGVHTRDLTVAQGAYLASLLQAPSQYDWAVAGDAGKKRVKARWNYTLDNMVEMHWLDAGKRQGLKFPVPAKPKPSSGMTGQKGYLVRLANQELNKQGITDDQIAAGGWTVTLGVEKKRQKALEAAVQEKLTSKLDPKARSVDADAQAGAVSVDPRTGHIVALYGGKGYLEHYLNNATRADYQPASTFKPLILATALEKNSTTQDGTPITPNTIYDGTSRRPVKGSAIGFAPPNEDEKDYGPISVQTAMNNSVNSVFAQMGVDVGLEKVRQTAGQLGMDAEKMSARPAMTLGSMGASPLQMAGVYATLDNHGKKITPQLVTHAQRGEEDPVELPDPVGGQVLTRQTADTVTSVLTGVVQDGTGTAVRNTDYDIAGKTGTSDDNKSAWFVGYTPRLVTAVGLFGENADPPHNQVTLRGAGGGGRVNGGGYPAEIWAAYTQNALGSEVSARFDLETDMGAGVAPSPTPTPTETEESESPSPTPSESAESESPSPSPTPSESESSAEPPEESVSPSPSESSDLPLPGDSGNDEKDKGTGNGRHPMFGG
ncbi:penicillin-binding protein [Streptomyces sp. Ru73]|uniref:transglycosylase domain-containing protein n=1 Tax=Streptomyces sp. Ru73 TaxID=2080748 RepID=UPI000CDDAF74|nr:transglycosylase domain-containing protein [Streptomyces sp. Ru73]POX41689.1 penicillin-binding protein [Streptomyces sp. Ru73]